MSGDRNQPQAIFDAFTDLDIKLDETNDLLEDLLTEQAQHGNALSEIASGMGREVDTAPNREFPWDMSTTVPADRGELDPLEEEIEINYDGRINRVLIGYPAGTQQAVGVQVGTPSETWIPRGTTGDPPYTAFDNEVITTNLNVEIPEGDPVVAKFINFDPNEAHFINVVLFVEEL